MRRRNIGKKVLGMLLALMMMLPMASLESMAAVGDLSNVSTGLTGNIDTEDTISLPIQIMDYENDGMLFEYAEAYAGVSTEKGEAKTAADFGATWAADFAKQTSAGAITNSMFGNFWSDVTTTLNTSNSYASYLKVKYNETTANNGGAFYGRASVITPNDLGGMAMNNVRYLVMVYRSNVTSGKIGFWVERTGLTTRTNANNRVGDLTFTSEGATNWTYAVYDLKQGNLGNTWTSYGNANAVFTTLPMDGSGEYIDIAHIALFSNEDQAKAFGEYALTDGSDRGDNRGFGLLRSSRTQLGETNYESIINQTGTVEQLNTYGDTTFVDFSTISTLGYTLLGTFGEKGIANVGLLESTLSEEGYPVYKEEVVTYLAGLLKHSLEIEERTSDGWKNYRYVQGSVSSIYGGTDLATALREKINKTMGTYAEAAGKKLVGTWAEVGNNIASYYDAAYFMLNSIFVNSSYNEPKYDYDYLVLSAGTDTESGDKVYVFDGGFATSSNPAQAQMAIDYDTTNHTIQNTSAAGKTHFVYEGTSTTTLNPFLPITDKNTVDGMTMNPYYQDDGVINGVKKQETKDTLYKRDFGFAMKSEGEFTYYADDELFFEFEGDDDVYLFINGELVMDIGSAHSIDKVRFELNDYVNAAKAGTLGSEARNRALQLEEGEVYDFKFYYMERHSYGSNIRICTNIRVTDPSMVTAKTAWQEGSALDFGSIIDKDKIVEYGFAITNNGEENLHNLTFTDNNIGVKLDPVNGLTVTESSRVYDVNGGILEDSDLTAVVSHPDYDDIHVTFANKAALKTFLADLSADGTEDGAGLYVGATVQIRGIGYKLSAAQISAGVFDNTVLTTATNKRETKTLQGQASMRVFVPADPMYYEWAGHNLKISKDKLVTDVLAAANQQDNILNNKVPNLTTSNVNKVELVTKTGTAISSSYVAIDSGNNLTVNYDSAGSKVFYVKITYNSSKNDVIVPVLVNVTNVKDSVYVLDYGLKVDLTKNNELIKNDSLTVPGRTTNYGVLAIGTDGAYSPNEITFKQTGTVEGEDGKFEYNEETVTYIPSDFMEEIDSVQVALNVYETDITPSKIAGTLDINNEVEMYKNIKVLPANVVYYEDNFPAIEYVDEQQPMENSFVVLGTEQSNDQNQEYGQDKAYQSNHEMSGGSLTTIVIDSSSTVASFEFTGTGFELIGRTNVSDSATLIVKVKDKDGNNLKTIPVITEYDKENDDSGEEEIYQVPVIKVKDLDIAKAPFTVEISGVPARDYDKLDANGNPTIIPTNLYVDGLRIYQPLGAENENYLDSEKGAEFIEIRNQIIDKNVAVAQWDSGEIEISTGITRWTTWVEDYYGNFKESQVNSVDDYLLSGPNNEVYMKGDYTYTALLFYVDATGKTTPNIQIGVHGVDEPLFEGAGKSSLQAAISYGTLDGDTYGWNELARIDSATEQYYSIDCTKCPIVNGHYQVMVSVDEGMVSFTNIKLNGLTLVDLETAETEQMLYSVRRQVVEPKVEEEPEVPETPEVPEEPEDSTKPGKTEKPEKPGKTEKPEKPGKTEKPEKPGKTEKPEKPGKAEKPEKPGKTEKQEKSGKTNKGWFSNFFGGWFSN